MSFWPKTIKEAQTFGYGQWAGNPKGRPYEPGFCMASVFAGGRSMLSRQCSRAIWKDGFCKQHHPETEAGKREKQHRQWEKEFEEKRRESHLRHAAPTMLEEMERYLPILEALERETHLWDDMAVGTGLATANGYREAIRKAKGEA